MMVFEGFPDTYTRHTILETQYLISHLTKQLSKGGFLVVVYNSEHSPHIRIEIRSQIKHEFQPGCVRGLKIKFLQIKK